MYMRKPTKLSTKRAELAANAVLAGPRKDRTQAAARRTRLLVWLYPGLERFQPMARRCVFADAKTFAYASHWPLRVAIVLIGVAGVLLLWLQGSEQARVGAWGCAVLTVIAQIVQRQVTLRRFIRRADLDAAQVDAGD